MTEDPVSSQGMEAIKDTTIPSTGEVAHHLGRIHQLIHYNSAQNPTEFNLDVETLTPSSVEYHNVP